uniref:Uncharacterized protein n=1 Tax=Meloidogyne incognita TaxID=6306 RepID=A0A914LL15_MELIC
MQSIIQRHFVFALSEALCSCIYKTHSHCLSQRNAPPETVPVINNGCTSNKAANLIAARNDPKIPLL